MNVTSMELVNRQLRDCTEWAQVRVGLRQHETEVVKWHNRPDNAVAG